MPGGACSRTKRVPAIVLAKHRLLEPRHALLGEASRLRDGLPAE